MDDKQKELKDHKPHKLEPDIDAIIKDIKVNPRQQFMWRDPYQEQLDYISARENASLSMDLIRWNGN